MWCNNSFFLLYFENVICRNDCRCSLGLRKSYNHKHTRVNLGLYAHGCNQHALSYLESVFHHYDLLAWFTHVIPVSNFRVRVVFNMSSAFSFQCRIACSTSVTLLKMCCVASYSRRLIHALIPGLELSVGWPLIKKYSLLISSSKMSDLVKYRIKPTISCKILFGILHDFFLSHFSISSLLLHGT